MIRDFPVPEYLRACWRDDKKENLSINNSYNVSRLENDNKTLRREKKELKLEFWQTQESSRDEIRRLEEDVKAANKKIRDTESKYINLAVTPLKGVD